jgi:flagellar hook-length control protein FliK
VVRALLWPKAEELWAFIVADIAAITAMTKTTALNVQSNATAGLDALFAALLQDAAQPAVPANDAGQPLGDNANLQSQPVAESQTVPQANLPNLLALLQSPAPQASGQPSGDSATAPQPTDDAAAPLSPLQPAPAGEPNPQVIDTAPPANNAANNAPKPAPAAAQSDQPQSTDGVTQDAQADTTLPDQDPPPVDQSDPPQTTDAKPAVKNAQQSDDAADAKKDQKAAPADQNATNIAVEVNLVAVAMPTLQTQVATSQPPPATNDPAPAIAAAAASAFQSPPMRGASQAPSGKSPTDADQAVADDGGAPKAEGSKPDASENDPLKADASKPADEPKSDASAAPLPSPQAAAPQSSASGQSAAVAAVQPQAAPASDPSVYLNLQVAPQHHADVTVAIDTFGVAIAAKSADGIKHFDIRLDPPELGRVEIRLSLDDSGKAQANLVVDKPQTLELLQRDASALTQSLNDAGVSLSNNGLNFSLRGQDRQSDSGSVAKGRSRSLSVKALVGTDAISNSGSIDSLALDSARLDIRV